MIHEYPYTNFNEYNLDWCVMRIRDLSKEWADTHQEWQDVQSEWTDYKNYIDNYFAQLDLSQEVSDKIDQMAANGYFSALFIQLFDAEIKTKAADTTSDWIADNLLQETGYVIDTSLTVANAAADAKAVGDIVFPLEDIVDEISEHVSSGNLYNEDDPNKVSGKYIDETTGNLENGASYTAWPDYIDISGISTLYFSSNLSLTIVLRYALYDNDKVFMAGENYSSAGTYDSNTRRYYHSVPTNGAKYLRISYRTAYINPDRLIMIGSDYVYRPYVSKTIPANSIDDPKAVNYVTGNDVLSDYAAAFSTGDTLSLTANHIQSDNRIVFVGNITDFERIDIGHYGGSPEQGIRFAVKQSDITWIVNGTSSTPIAHGLTIQDYIRIEIDIRRDLTYDIKIDTNGGSYTRNANAGWNGFYGSVAAFPVGTTNMTNCTLMQVIPDLQSPVWFFGDSYLGYSPERWSYYMYNEGIKHVLINAYPGAGSLAASLVFDDLIDLGKPKYIVWALGMNDTDTLGSPNARWQVEATDFVNACIQHDVVPVLCTIPNTPTVRNIEKNDFVRNYGVQYIDFAKIVDAESANALWYSGMLSDDNTHPTEYGARALYGAVLQGFPEIFNHVL